MALRNPDTRIRETLTILGGHDRHPGTGSPEGVIAAPIGGLYPRTGGGTGSTWYCTELGIGNTGWVAK